MIDLVKQKVVRTKCLNAGGVFGNEAIDPCKELKDALNDGYIVRDKTSMTDYIEYIVEKDTDTPEETIEQVIKELGKLKETARYLYVPANGEHAIDYAITRDALVNNLNNLNEIADRLLGK